MLLSAVLRRRLQEVHAALERASLGLLVRQGMRKPPVPLEATWIDLQAHAFFGFDGEGRDQRHTCPEGVVGHSETFLRPACDERAADGQVHLLALWESPVRLEDDVLSLAALLVCFSVHTFSPIVANAQ